MKDRIGTVGNKGRLSTSSDSAISEARVPPLPSWLADLLTMH